MILPTYVPYESIRFPGEWAVKVWWHCLGETSIFHQKPWSIKKSCNTCDSNIGFCDKLFEATQPDRAHTHLNRSYFTIIPPVNKLLGDNSSHFHHTSTAISVIVLLLGSPISSYPKWGFCCRIHIHVSTSNNYMTWDIRYITILQQYFASATAGI